MKGSITFHFDYEDTDQAQAYWRAMIEASRPASVVDVSQISIQLMGIEADNAVPWPEVDES